MFTTTTAELTASLAMAQSNARLAAALESRATDSSQRKAVARMRREAESAAAFFTDRLAFVVTA